MVASLWHQLLSTKVRLLVGLPAGVLRGGSMRACGGEDAVADNMHGVNIPTFSHQLRCRIHGQRSQVRVSDEEYQSYIDIYLLLETMQNRLHHLLSLEDM